MSTNGQLASMLRNRLVRSSVLQIGLNEKNLIQTKPAKAKTGRENNQKRTLNGATWCNVQIDKQLVLKGARSQLASLNKMAEVMKKKLSHQHPR